MNGTKLTGKIGHIKITGLEALKDLCEFVNYCDEANEAVGIIEKALQRLEAIDNANSSEALYCLKTIKGEQQKYSLPYDEEIKIIKQALTKAQEQEKVLKILFEKDVDIWNIKLYDDYEDYCKGKEKYLLRKDLWLTQEEFDLLKRWVEDD